MGIDKPDIQHIIRLGVPENICSWAQELGRAGRNGQFAVATIFYSISQILMMEEHGSGNMFTILIIVSRFLRNLVIPGSIPCLILLENVEGKYFSGFSVGFCINEEEGYLLPTIARKITCRRFD